MKKKLVLGISLLLLLSLLITGGFFLLKFLNRSSTATKVKASSDLPGYILSFHSTQLFADFLFDRGLWRNGGVRISKLQPPQTVSEMQIILHDKKDYKGKRDLSIPVLVTSQVIISGNGNANRYLLDVFVGEEQRRMYAPKDIAHAVFLATLSQIYEDTSSQTTSLKTKVSKSALLNSLDAQPRANPFILERSSTNAH